MLTLPLLLLQSLLLLFLFHTGGDTRQVCRAAWQAAAADVSHCVWCTPSVCSHTREDLCSARWPVSAWWRHIWSHQRDEQKERAPYTQVTIAYTHTYILLYLYSMHCTVCELMRELAIAKHLHVVLYTYMYALHCVSTHCHTVQCVMLYFVVLQSL